jgi:hypothetical protein
LSHDIIHDHDAGNLIFDFDSPDSKSFDKRANAFSLSVNYNGDWSGQINRWISRLIYPDRQSTIPNVSAPEWSVERLATIAILICSLAPADELRT